MIRQYMNKQVQAKLYYYLLQSKSVTMTNFITIKFMCRNSVI